MSGHEVTRLRVSHVAGRLHDRLSEIGGPVAFAQRLADPQPVLGLPVTLPFGDGLPVDTRFWSGIAERRLPVPVPVEDAPKLRRSGVPLRCGGTLKMAADTPRVEAHLHPYGIVVLTTVDLSWPEPVAVESVWEPVLALADRPATVTFAGVERATTLGQAATAAAAMLVDRLAEPGGGQSWDLTPYQISTVINGRFAGATTAMPAPNSALHEALHRLSGGDEVLADPTRAFVAQWSGGGYEWPSANLLYMLDRGTSAFSAAAAGDPRPQQRTASDRHRELLLMVAYLLGSAGLVRAGAVSGSELIQEWARTAAARLGILFGPGRAFQEWGLTPRELLSRIGASEDVQRVLGTPLTANAAYPVGSYRWS